jgi:hypothetical protein
MATIAKKAVQVAKTLHGGPPAILHFPEAATQSFKLGEFVYLTGGKVAAYVADGSSILGIALQDASGTTDTSIPVALATADTIFVGNVDASLTTAQSNVGQAYDLNLTSNKWHVDTSSIAAARALVVGLDSRDTVGDIAGRVLFTILGDYRQIDVTS